MIDGTLRWLGGHLWRTLGYAERNRAVLHRGTHGLRVLALHETGPRELRSLARIVDMCRRSPGLATLADADALFAGRWPHDGDRVLFTFDDGFASNHAAARWLADQGVQATFFVVPSLVDRTVNQYVRFHAERGVTAGVPRSVAGDRGLSREQIREIVAMGHRVGAHNFAHRNLRKLHAEVDFAYEIDGAVAGIEELTLAPCLDFAIGYGQPGDLSDEAARRLATSGLRVYACHGGLNVPGRSPRFALRHAVEPRHPMVFTRACLEGAGDHNLHRLALQMVQRVGALPEAP